jgi:hypothetical protein
MAAVLRSIGSYSNHPSLFTAGLQNKLRALFITASPIWLSIWGGIYSCSYVKQWKYTVLTYPCNLLQRHFTNTEVLGIFVTSRISVTIQVIFYMDLGATAMNSCKIVLIIHVCSFVRLSAVTTLESLKGFQWNVLLGILCFLEDIPSLTNLIIYDTARFTEIV